jgi:hypothetical protein
MREIMLCMSLNTPCSGALPAVVAAAVTAALVASSCSSNRLIVSLLLLPPLVWLTLLPADAECGRWWGPGDGER